AVASLAAELVGGSDVGGAGLADDVAAMGDAAALARRNHRAVAAGHQRRRSIAVADAHRRVASFTALVAIDDLAEILGLQQAARLHLCEDLGPAAMRLEVGDLVQAEWRRPGCGRALRQEQRAADFPVAGRERFEAARFGRCRRGRPGFGSGSAAGILRAGRRRQRQHHRRGDKPWGADHCADALRRRSPRATAASSCSVSAVCRMISVAVALSFRKMKPSLATTRMRVVMSVRLSNSISTVRSLAEALSFQPVSVFWSSVSGMPMRSSVFNVAKRTSLAGDAKVL